MATGSYLSIITLKVNGLNDPNQKTKTGWMDTKTRPLYTLSLIDSPQNRGHIQTESEGAGKRYSMQIETKRKE